jgi:predicted phosphodiesterase
MRYAIISDIHSNIDALNSFTGYLKVNPVDKIVCLGDIIGYGANPCECIDAVKAIPNFRSTLGNHDAAAIGKVGSDTFNEDAKLSLDQNKALLRPDDIAYLSSLPESISENNLLFVHGSPKHKITEYLFLMDKFKENIRSFNESICFVGHTHHPLVYQYETGTGKDTCINIEEDMEVFTLSAEKKYIINVGSIGQPRDNKPSSCAVFFDTKSNTLSFKRIQYDIQSAQKRMREAKLPESLIARLAIGY